MKVRYELLRVDSVSPMGLVPRRVVIEAVEAFKRRGTLELCRADRDDPFPAAASMAEAIISKLAQQGQILEVIGKVFNLWIEQDTLMCEGEMKDNLFWPQPQEDYVAIPYLDFHHRRLQDNSLPDCHRVITQARFTDVVLVYQAVRRLVERKYRERKPLVIKALQKPQ